jgi:hypothetical protein
MRGAEAPSTDVRLGAGTMEGRLDDMTLYRSWLELIIREWNRRPKSNLHFLAISVSPEKFLTTEGKEDTEETIRSGVVKGF